MLLLVFFLEWVAWLLGQKCSHNSDLDKAECRNLTICNGPPGFQVRRVAFLILKKIKIYLFQVKPIFETYMSRTEAMRVEESRLFISLYKPFGSIVSVTVRNNFISATFCERKCVISSGLSLLEILAMSCWRNQLEEARIINISYCLLLSCVHVLHSYSIYFCWTSCYVLCKLKYTYQC